MSPRCTGCFIVNGDALHTNIMQEAFLSCGPQPEVFKNLFLTVWSIKLQQIFDILQPGVHSNSFLTEERGGFRENSEWDVSCNYLWKHDLRWNVFWKHRPMHSKMLIILINLCVKFSYYILMQKKMYFLKSSKGCFNNNFQHQFNTINCFHKL